MRELHHLHLRGVEPMLQTLNREQTSAQQRGFTLIELMVVIAVVATLVMLVAPSFKRMIDTQRVRSVNAALVTDLQFARSEAASRNRRVFLRFDNTGSTLTCYVVLEGASPSFCDCKRPPGTACTGPADIKEIRTVQVDRSLGLTVSLPSGVTQTTMGFDPATGRLLIAPLDVPVEATGDFLIDVRNSSVGGLRTSVSPTGRPSVCSPLGEISGAPACS